MNRSRRILLLIPTALEALHFYGAAGIACFGWALARLLHFDSAPYLPLWFVGGLLIYNIDRLKADPADAINIPGRSGVNARLRYLSALIAVVSAGAFVLIPLAMRDWRALALTLAGGLAGASYSVPLLGFRLKDVPLLKTFFPPGMVVAASLTLPFIQQGLQVSAVHFVIVTTWACAFLFFNMMLCDLRDIEGDRVMGTLSVPVFLGKKHTFSFLVLLLIGVVALAETSAFTAPQADAMGWHVLAVATASYLAILLIASKKPRGEWFYAWCVEGMLFLPGLVLIAAR